MGTKDEVCTCQYARVALTIERDRVTGHRFVCRDCGKNLGASIGVADLLALRSTVDETLRSRGTADILLVELDQQRNMLSQKVAKLRAKVRARGFALQAANLRANTATRERDDLAEYFKAVNSPAMIGASLTMMCSMMRTRMHGAEVVSREARAQKKDLDERIGRDLVPLISIVVAFATRYRNLRKGTGSGALVSDCPVEGKCALCRDDGHMNFYGGHVLCESMQPSDQENLICIAAGAELAKSFMPAKKDCEHE